MEIDFDRLRSELKNYYGTAMYGGFPMAMMELSVVERASDEELIDLAEQQGLDLEEYEIDE